MPLNKLGRFSWSVIGQVAVHVEHARIQLIYPAQLNEELGDGRIFRQRGKVIWPNGSVPVGIVSVFSLDPVLLNDEGSRVRIRVFPVHDQVCHYFPEYLGAKAYPLITFQMKFIGQVLRHEVHEPLVGLD